MIEQAVIYSITASKHVDLLMGISDLKANE
jgi:hypothetical protein